MSILKALGIPTQKPTTGDLAWAACTIAACAGVLSLLNHYELLSGRMVWIGTVGGAIGAVASAHGISLTKGGRGAVLVLLVVFFAVLIMGA